MSRTLIAAKGAHALKSDCTQPFYSNRYYNFLQIWKCTHLWAQAKICLQNSTKKGKTHSSFLEDDGLDWSSWVLWSWLASSSSE